MAQWECEIGGGSIRTLFPGPVSFIVCHQGPGWGWGGNKLALAKGRAGSSGMVGRGRLTIRSRVLEDECCDMM